MNEEYILKKLKPYLNATREISEYEFIEAFGMLTKLEQYEVIKIMIKNDIDYVDVKEEIHDETNIPLTKVFVKQKIVTNKIYSNLSNEELCVLYQNGDKNAAGSLIEKNQQFIMKTVLKRKNRYKHDLEIEDLFQEGALGLLVAASKFNQSLEYTFLTYAWHFIRNKVDRAIMDTGNIIRIPVHVYEKLTKLLSIQRCNMDKNENELMDIVCCEMSWSIEEVNKLFFYREHYLNCTSLNDLVGENQETELIQFIPSEEELLEDQVINNQLIIDVRKTLSSLSERECEVLKERFGINDGIEHTLEEVGSIFGVTRERIRQIESKALRRLRHPSRSENIKCYL